MLNIFISKLTADKLSIFYLGFIRNMDYMAKFNMCYTPYSIQAMPEKMRELVLSNE